MCKRTLYKRARIPMFLWERRACSNSGAQAVFPRPRKNGLGTRLVRMYVKRHDIRCTYNMRMRMQFRLSFAQMSVKIIKNEVRCRDDTMPKTENTRKHCKVGLRACNNPSLHLCFSGLQKIVAYSQPYLAVLSCIYSFWHGVIPTSYFIFNTCI